MTNPQPETGCLPIERRDWRVNTPELLAAMVTEAEAAMRKFQRAVQSPKIALRARARATLDAIESYAWAFAVVPAALPLGLLCDEIDESAEPVRAYLFHTTKPWVEAWLKANTTKHIDLLKMNVDERVRVDEAVAILGPVMDSIAKFAATFDAE